MRLCFQTILFFYTADPKWRKTWEMGRFPEHQSGKWGRSCMEHPWFGQQTKFNTTCPSGILTCCRQSHSTGYSWRWIKEPCFPGLQCSTLQAMWWRTWRAPRKSTRHKADGFRYQHFLYGPNIMDITAAWMSFHFQTGAAHTACTDPHVFQQELRGCKPGMNTRASAPSRHWQTTPCLNFPAV